MRYLEQYKVVFCFLLFLWSIGIGKAQNFENGNLEGDDPLGLSYLPDFWEAVPYTDINCLASSVAKATPDLISETEPFPEFGLSGIPYSGNTSVFGLYSRRSNGEYFHEGIMQYVTGFNIGDSCQINFFQSVLRGASCRDTSGSWAIFLNDSLLEVSSPSSSLISYMSVDLEWEERIVSFIAEEESYWIKFLPWDDDTNHLCDEDIPDGGLGMAIDCIRLNNLSTFTHENLIAAEEVKIYPNPTTGFTNIELADHNKFKVIQIIDVQGRILREYLSPVSNQMRIELPDTAGVYLIKVVTEKGDSIHKVLKI